MTSPHHHLEPAPRRWVEPALIVAFWTVMAVLTAASQVLDPRFQRAGIEPRPLAIAATAFVYAYCWAALTPLLFRITRRLPLERGHRVGRLLALLGIGVLIATSVDAVNAYIRFEVLAPPRMRARAFDPMFGVQHLFWIDDLIVYFAVLAAGFARDYFTRLQARHAATALYCS